MHKNTLKYSISCIFLLLSVFSPFGKFYAQTTPDSLVTDAGLKDTVPSQSTAVVDLTKVRIGSGGLDDKIDYTAEDSIWFDVKRKQVHLYGNASVNYTSINLKAGYILLDYENNTITGKPLVDSLGRESQLPEFADKAQKFSARELKYNFKTKKGIIKEAYTTQESLYVLGKKAKFVQTESKDTTIGTTNTIYNQDALITTCNHPDPHYGVRARKLKVIPDKLVVVGPSVVEIEGVPTPLVLPFGFFPITKTRTQGIIMPRDFNFNDPRGLGIKDFGYYIPIGQNADLKLNADYYLRGSYSVAAISRYAKRYKYNGSADIGFSNYIGEDNLAKKFSTKSYHIRWSHNQDSKANPYHKFGGTINLETNQESNRNNNDFRSVYNNNRNSSLTYSRIFAGKPYTLQSSFTHSQVTSTRRMTVNFPSIDFNLRQIYPFKSQKADGKDQWYERISLTYSSKFRNTFQGTDSTFFSRSTLDSANYAAEHRASSDFQFKLFKYINIAPRVNYQEAWYWRTIDRYLDPTVQFVFDTINDNGEILLVVDSAATKWGTVRTDMVKGFTPFRTFDASISANTTLYNTRQFKKGWLRGIRHTVTPSISFGYTPDFTKDKYNYFRTYQTDVRSDVAQDREYSIFEQSQFVKPNIGTPPLSIGYSLRNVLGLKYFSKKDTASKKLTIFNNLTFSGNYSITADTLKWSPISTGGTFRLFKNYTTLNWNLSFDPYKLEENTGKRVNRFLYKEDGKLLRISTLSASINTGFTVQQLRDLFKSKDEVGAKRTLNTPNPDDFIGMLNSFRFNHTFGIDKRTTIAGQDTFVVSRNSLGVNGEIPLTAMWKFRVNNISYDLISKRLVYPDIGIVRDLHCWGNGIKLAASSWDLQFYNQRKKCTTRLLEAALQKGQFGKDIWVLGGGLSLIISKSAACEQCKRTNKVGFYSLLLQKVFIQITNHYHDSQIALLKPQFPIPDTLPLPHKPKHMAKFSISVKPKAKIILIPLREISPSAPLPASVIEATGISAELIATTFKGKAKETLPILQAPSTRIYLFGLGSKIVPHQVLESIRLFFFQNIKVLTGAVSIDMRHIGEMEGFVDLMTAVIEGAAMGLHIPTKPLKPTEFPDYMVTEVELCVDAKFAEGEKKNILHRGQKLAEIRCAMIDLVNKPANFKTPLMMADFVVRQGKKYHFDVKVLDDKHLRQEGFNGILAIGQGSPNESAFIKMHYQADRKDLPHIGLVGKGITFDTGGISIKPSDNMHYMKSDMGGAAAMIGTMMAVAALQLPVRLTAVVASAENMPDGNAVKPSDVISTYSGKSIEMIDIDAEGRVVLADALAWMVRNEKPDYMIDAATLTGSIVRALGYKAGGMFTNNETLSVLLMKSGEASGERLWPMPLWDDYLDEIASDVADVRNFSGVATGGSISAAKFLEAFTEKHPAWAHLDIAGMAFGSSNYTKMKSASGYGIKLLLHFIENLKK